MDKIEISMEEYKELLEIKGRYEELKSASMQKICDGNCHKIGCREPIDIKKDVFGNPSITL